MIKLSKTDTGVNVDMKGETESAREDLIIGFATSLLMDPDTEKDVQITTPLSKKSIEKAKSLGLPEEILDRIDQVTTSNP